MKILTLPLVAAIFVVSYVLQIVLLRPGEPIALAFVLGTISFITTMVIYALIGWVASLWSD